jgi:hypothetical protein
MPPNSTIDLQARWTLLGREMSRGCDYMNHHFRCVAGEVKFMWLLKHTMFASVNDFPRLTIHNGTANRKRWVGGICNPFVRGRK